MVARMSEPSNKIVIDPSDLVPMNVFIGEFPIAVHVAYADAEYVHNHFPGLYAKEASLLWLHKGIADVVLAGAMMAHQRYGWTLELKDGFRPVEAQERMAEHGIDPMLLARPGNGAHPRAMGVDICLLDRDGREVDMGTPFDFFAPDPQKDNPAARNYTGFNLPPDEIAAIVHRRHALEFCMLYAGLALDKRIEAIEHEWWDYRLPRGFFEAHAPLREKDVLPFQRMIEPDAKAVASIAAGHIPQELKGAIDFVRNEALRAYRGMTC